MPSDSLKRWSGERSIALDEIEHAHARVGGTARGRRYATEQINHAYAAILSAQFQGFCRNLHSECVDYTLGPVPEGLRALVRNQFSWGRALDRGNANPGNIGIDFGRFGIAFWPLVDRDSPRNGRRRAMLEDLNAWRNAIAHQDFDPIRLRGRSSLQVATVRRWRHAVDGLARSFDFVMLRHLTGLLGRPPWSSSHS